MNKLKSVLHKIIYRFGWDTRRRNIDVAKVVKPMLSKKSKVLDVGCGQMSVAEFIPSADVFGVDILDETEIRNNSFRFIRGSITNLPFADKSFPIVVSIDVMEHLSSSDRVKALTEILRVANDTILLAFPSGKSAYKIDKNFNDLLERYNKPKPDWLIEHLSNLYPEAENIIEDFNRIVKETRRDCKSIEINYSEPLSVTHLLRTINTKSNKFYILANLFFGVIPQFLQPNKENSYRTIILLQLN